MVIVIVRVMVMVIAMVIAASSDFGHPGSTGSAGATAAEMLAAGDYDR